MSILLITKLLKHSIYSITITYFAIETYWCYLPTYILLNTIFNLYSNTVFFLENRLGAYCCLVNQTHSKHSMERKYKSAPRWLFVCMWVCDHSTDFIV